MIFMGRGEKVVARMIKKNVSGKGEDEVKALNYVDGKLGLDQTVTIYKSNYAFKNQKQLETERRILDF